MIHSNYLFLLSVFLLAAGDSADCWDVDRILLKTSWNFFAWSPVTVMDIGQGNLWTRATYINNNCHVACLAILCHVTILLLWHRSEEVRHPRVIHTHSTLYWTLTPKECVCKTFPLTRGCRTSSGHRLPGITDCHIDYLKSLVAGTSIIIPGNSIAGTQWLPKWYRHYCIWHMYMASTSIS